MNPQMSWLVAAVLLSGLAAVAAQAAPRPPMPLVEADSAQARWLAKPALESRLLDDMESADPWQHHGPGAMSFTAERRRTGKQSIRLTSPTKLAPSKPGGGRPFGEATLRRRFEKEDWSAFNRLSVWVYPTMKGHLRSSVLLKLATEGGRKPAMGPWVRGAMNYVLLRPGEWNHIVWEIAHLPRAEVTALDLIYRLQGNEPGAAESVTLDFDRLELQRVEPDCFAGWAVAPGRIAFCHTGYDVGTRKVALAGDLKAAEFSVVDKAAGKAVLTKPVAKARTPLGEFQELDFSELDAPGEYVLRAGDVETRSFRIGRNVWARTAEKVVNFFYGLRCGAAVPGLHGVCHADIIAEHAGRRIVTNGGWHDAGDLSQGEINTAEGVHSMLCLAERLAGRDKALTDRLVAEAVWGLKWLLKTRFSDGSRVVWQTMDFWSDNIVGNFDDGQAQVGDGPYENFIGAKAEALAARLLKTADAALARESLAAAEADWKAALAKLKDPGVELAAEAVLASVELFRATGDRAYADKAAELARTVLDCQQTTIPDWPVPLTGWFCHNAKKDRIVHYAHRGHGQAAVVALAAMCEALPDHADWMLWYAAAALHSDYQRAAAEFDRPWRVLPAGVYPVRDNPAEVALGVKLSATHGLRRFPVTGEWRGHFGVLLSQAKALSAAARLRGDKALAELARDQLRWVVGRNPFAQSAMTGEGYDFQPLYTPMCGELVGAIPVGIQYRAGTDEPYWPPSNSWHFKEVWVHPASRWLWVLADLLGEADAAPAGAARLTVTQQTAPDGQVTIIVRAVGKGDCGLAVRAWNLKLPDAAGKLRLEAGKAVEVRFTGQVERADTPWVAVVVPDGDLRRGRDVTGSVRPVNGR